MTQLFPHSNLDTANFDSYTNHKNLARCLSNKYVMSFFPSDIKSDACPTRGSVNDRLPRISDYADRGKEILSIFSLVEAGSPDTFFSCIYDKDATSSGSQIMGLVINNLCLAAETNAVSDAIPDTCLDCITALKARAHEQARTLQKFFLSLFHTAGLLSTTVGDSPSEHLIFLSRAPPLDDFDHRYSCVRDKFPPLLQEGIGRFHFPVTNLDNTVTDADLRRAKKAALYETLCKACQYHITTTS